ncbi:MULTISPECIES: hypothetical protein [unclassified Bradyrhizobium]|uniref:hypothetical protein n=1 Tax=Bradyrhizobium sp. USDA 4541 TaxID=2817704 RepID=UPI0020A5B876|nr:hypothetical protein [Bradyrhizobium sp. USDA 4541]MCP1850482.1 hypothetical protein [Bradyrhizobium sp. USDA 4541]
MRAKHQGVRTAYATVARALANSPDARDRALSENVTRFLDVKRHPELPPLRHEELPPPSGYDLG